MKHSHITEAQLAEVFSRNPGDALKVLTLPTGKQVIIREQNGDDDSVISNISSLSGSNSLNPLNLFLHGIIVFDPDSENKSGQPFLTEIKDLPIRDKYVALIGSRIFSLGSEMEFEHIWSKDMKIPYTQDLNEFIWDYSTPFPIDESHRDFHPERIAPYPLLPNEDYLYYTFSDNTVHSLMPPISNIEAGKSVRFKLLDGHGEQILMDIGESRLNINSRLQARGMQLYSHGDWVTLNTFKMFRSLEMSKLRQVIELYDKEYLGLVEVDHPTTGETNYIRLMSIPNFFFPLGI
jgi:hypothetical protein